MNTETWEQFLARTSANRKDRVAQCDNDQERNRLRYYDTISNFMEKLYDRNTPIRIS